MVKLCTGTALVVLLAASSATAPNHINTLPTATWSSAEQGIAKTYPSCSASTDASDFSVSISATTSPAVTRLPGVTSRRTTFT